MQKACTRRSEEPSQHRPRRRRFQGEGKVDHVPRMGTDGGKAMLVGLGKEDDADVHAYRKAGAAVIAGRKKSLGTELTVRFAGAPSVDCMAVPSQKA